MIISAGFLCICFQYVFYILYDRNWIFSDFLPPSHLLTVIKSSAKIHSFIFEVEKLSKNRNISQPTRRSLNVLTMDRVSNWNPDCCLANACMRIYKAEITQIMCKYCVIKNEKGETVTFTPYWFHRFFTFRYLIF